MTESFDDIIHDFGIGEPAIRTCEPGNPADSRPTSAGAALLGDPTLATDLIDAVAAVYNDALPGLFARCIDIEAQRRAIIERLDSLIVERLSRLDRAIEGLCAAPEPPLSADTTEPDTTYYSGSATDCYDSGDVCAGEPTEAPLRPGCAVNAISTSPDDYSDDWFGSPEAYEAVPAAAESEDVDFGFHRPVPRPRRDDCDLQMSLW